MDEKDILNEEFSAQKRKSSPLVMPPPPKASAPVKPIFFTPQDSEPEVEKEASAPVKPIIFTPQGSEPEAEKEASEPVKKESKAQSELRNEINDKSKKKLNIDFPIMHGETPKKPEPVKEKEPEKVEIKEKTAPKAKAKNVEKKRERVIGFSESDYYDYEGYRRRKPKSERLSGGKIAGRIAIVFASLLLFAVIALYSLCFVIAKGPSETVRNLLVLSAKQASATKWVPSLFLDSDTIDAIMAGSEKVEMDVISLEDYHASSDESENENEEDEWADAKDGMIFKTLKGPTYTAYMLLIKDPSRVFVGTSSDNYAESEKGKNIFEATKAYGAVAAINGGEFPDTGGIGTGEHPIGLTFADGKCVWNDGTKRTFIGFDENDRLIVREGMTKAEAEELNIRDAVSFQTGNVLISSDGESVTFYYAEGNNGTAQRTAIGQRADGTVIMLVTDGRSASSLGATHNDVIDIMVEHGAISAAMLDGGSSAMMYYENYYDKYGYDHDSLDQYQKKGLVNKYKAFTNPRYMPTFFMVAKEEGGSENAE